MAVLLRITEPSTSGRSSSTVQTPSSISPEHFPAIGLFAALQFPDAEIAALYLIAFSLINGVAHANLASSSAQDTISGARGELLCVHLLSLLQAVCPLLPAWEKNTGTPNYISVLFWMTSVVVPPLCKMLIFFDYGNTHRRTCILARNSQVELPTSTCSVATQDTLICPSPHTMQAFPVLRNNLPKALTWRRVCAEEMLMLGCTLHVSIKRERKDLYRKASVCQRCLSSPPTQPFCGSLILWFYGIGWAESAKNWISPVANNLSDTRHRSAW